jgi:alkylation response protein AidB-like acyl-CoA dehydrogenase
MRFLANERAVLERFLPGLDEKLRAVPFMDLESPGSPGIGLFRDAGGAGLVIPSLHGGGGASALQTAQLTRALATRSPSLAVATTMHQFSVASLVALAESSSDPTWMMLDAVARDRRLMSSGFAEGRTSQAILAPAMKGVWDGKNWRVSGRKQPCSLSRSMDLLTASVLLHHPEQGERVAIALIPAASPGITIRPFWASPVLGGAESDSVILEDVEVHPDLIVELTLGLHGELDDLQTLGFVWFELLVAACYLGTAGALVEMVLDKGRAPVYERASLAMAYEAAALALDAAARDLDEGKGDNDALARSLIVRFTTADAVRAMVTKSVELLGGMAFIESPKVAYLAAASHAIAFHPPSMHSSAEAMLAWFGGRPIVME